MVVKTEIMFKLLKLVKKTGIFQDMKKLFKKVNNISPEELKRQQDEAGTELLIMLISNLDQAENEFYDIIASVKEIDIDQARNLELEQTIEVLSEVLTSGAFKGFLALFSK